MKHIIGHIGDDFMGQMTQPIVSSIKALKDNDIATVNVCVCVCVNWCSQHHIAVVDLNSPRDIVRRIARQSRWAISCVEWNPHPSHADYFLAAVSPFLV